MRIDNKVLAVCVLVFVSLWASSKYTEAKINKERVSRARSMAHAQEVSYRMKQMELIKLVTTELVLNRAIHFINNF